MLTHDVGDRRRQDPARAAMAYTDWVQRTRGRGSALIVAIECMDLFHFECLSPNDRDELINSVQLKLATLASAPGLLIHLDGPFFVVGFTATGRDRVATLARHVLVATLAAARSFTNTNSLPVVALLRPAVSTAFETLLDQSAAALVDVRRDAHRSVASTNERALT